MNGLGSADSPGRDFLGTDRFLVQEKLGEGSMGAVYLAFDRERKMQVALKTLRRVDASGIYRFKREFRALADVHHRNLVVLHELFVEGAEWFFTMEYVQGTSFLDQLLGPARAEIAPSPFAGDTRATRELRGVSDALLPSPMQDQTRLRDLFSQVTEGLSAVHAAGQLHRDLKPDNVLVTADDRAVVLDFGIAVERFADGEGTLDAGVMGTPAYMSPEQAAGVPVTEATDWYSLGVMLFEALTGRVPFDGDYLDVLRQKQRYDAPRPSHLCSGIPDDLDALCAALLSRDPALRPAGDEVLRGLGGGPAVSERPAVAREEQGSPFVARADALRQLHGALRSTDEDKPVVVFVQGMTGMGKSALVERFVDEVSSRADTVVLKGRCYEREMVPFKAFDSLVDTLSRYLRRTPTINAADVMPRDIEALAQLFPVLRRVDVVNRIQRRHGLPTDLRELRRRAFGALKELLKRLADQHRVVLYVDDLQWGDVDSARLIGDIIAGPGAPALLFVCTYRSGDVQDSPCLQTLFAQTRETGAADIRQLTVGPLHTDDIRTLAEQLLEGDADADIDALARESRGSPYVLSELIGHYQRSGEAGYDSRRPVSLDAALADKLAALEEEPASVLEIVAVSGRPVNEEVLEALGGETLSLHDALQRLRQDKLVRGVGGEGTRAVEIYHDGIRRAVLSRMDDSLVRRWHGRLADALEASGTPDLQALTEHLIGAADFARASIYAIRAATQASRSMAFDKAAQLYELAVKHHEDEAWQQELRVQWAEALINAGRSSMAAEVFIDAAEHAGTEEEALMLERRAGTELIVAGQFARGYAVLRRTLAALDIKLDESRGQAISRVLLLSEHLKARGLSFTTRPEHLVEAADLERLDAAFEIQRAFLVVYPIRVTPLIAQHLIDCLDCGEPRRIVQAACAYYVAIESTLDHDGANHPVLQLAERLVKETRDPSSRAEVAMASGWHYQYRGLLAPALLHDTQAEELYRTRCQGRALEVRLCRVQMARLYQMLGRLDELRNVEEWAREAEDREDRIFGTHLRLLSVLGLLVEDRYEDAVRLFAQIRDRLDEQRFGISTLLETLVTTQLSLYVQDARDRPPEASYTASGLWVIEPWRSDHELAHAQLAVVSALGAEGFAVEEHLATAEQALEKLEGYQRDYLADHMRLLRAAIAHLRDDEATAIEILEAILGDGEQAGDGPIVLSCARLRRGQLMGDEGKFVVEQASRELSQRGVVAPLRFVNLYAPGFRFGDQPTRMSIDVELPEP